MRQLPANIAVMSEKGKKLFIEALKSTERFSMRILTSEEKAELFQKQWKEIEKTIPRGQVIDKVFFVIQVTGAVFFVVITAMIARL
jgi:hypothetical protein